MPKVNGTVTTDGNTTITQFTGTATHNTQTFYFDDTQNSMIFSTTGHSDLTLKVDERSYIVRPNVPVEIYEDFSSFNVTRKDKGSQTFDLSAYVFADDNTITFAPVEDNLTSTNPKSALSANQGRVLKGLVDTNTANITINTNNITTNTAQLADKAPKKKTDTWIDVKQDFGAKGDGVTDDTTSIQNAMNSLGDGDTLYFPKGVYLISNGLIIDTIPNITIRGSRGAIIRKKNTGVEFTNLFIYNPINLLVEDIAFEGFRTSMTNLIAGDYGLKVQSGENVRVQNCSFRNFADACLGFGAFTSRDPNNLQFSKNIWVINNTFDNIWQTSTTPVGAVNYYFEQNTCTNINGAIKFSGRSGACTNLFINDNIILGTGMTGSCGLEIASYINVKAENNTIDNFDYGINYYINTASGSASSDVQKLRFNRNEITNSKTVGIRVSNNADFAGVKYRVKSLEVNGNTIDGSLGNGINLVGNQFDLVVISNRNEFKNITNDVINHQVDYHLGDANITVSDNTFNTFSKVAINLKNNNATSTLTVDVSRNKVLSTVTTSYFLSTASTNKYIFYIFDNRVSTYNQCVLVAVANRFVMQNNDMVSTNQICVNITATLAYIRTNNLSGSSVAIRHDSGSTGTTYTFGNSLIGSVTANGQTLTTITP